MQVKVDLGSQPRDIQASGSQANLVEVVAQVVDRSSVDTSTRSGYRVVAQGQASVAPGDQSVIITMEVPIGVWDLYIFGIDDTGVAAARATSQQITVNAGTVLVIRTSLLFDSQFLNINPASASLAVGDTVDFTADVFLSDGSVSHSVTWSSDNTAVITIDQTGHAIAVGTGNANILAISTVNSSIQSSAPVSVASGIAQVRAVFSQGANTTVSLGQTGLSFTTDVDFTNGTTQTGVAGATYASSNASVVTIDPTTGAVTVVGPGSADITSTFGGVTSAPVTLTVNAPRLVAITSEVGQSRLQSYLVDTSNTGALTPVSLLTGQPDIGIGYTASGPSFVAYDIPAAVRTVQVAADGTLSGAASLGGFTAVNELAGSGNFLYVDDLPGAGNDLLSTFQLSGGAFTAVGGPVDSGLTNASAMAFSSLLPALYVATHNGGTNPFVRVFTLGANGAPGAGNSTLVGDLPSAVLVHPSGRILLVAEFNGVSGQLETFNLDPATGAITGPADVQAIARPNIGSSHAMVASGSFVYVLDTNGTNNFIDGFAVDPNTGNIVPAGSLTVGNQVFSIAIDPTGHFLYHANNTTGQIEVSPINQTTGALGAPNFAASLTGLFKLEMLP